MRQTSAINLSFSLFFVTGIISIVLGCTKANFYGGTKMAAREKKVISSSERSIETTKKLNLWVVTRQQNEAKRWDNVLVQQGSQNITVNNVDQLSVGMKLSGPGIDSECDDPSTPATDCVDWNTPVITAIDQATKTLTIRWKLRSFSSPVSLNLTSQSSSSQNYWMDVSTDVLALRPGMILEGPGLNEECDDLSTTEKTCPGAATIMSIQPNTPSAGVSRLVLDRFFGHKPKDVENVTSAHLSNSFTLNAVTGISVDMVVAGAGLTLNCAAPCPGRALITAVDTTSKTVTLDKTINHANGLANTGLTYTFYEKIRSNLAYRVRGGDFTGTFVAKTGIAHWLQLEGDKILQHKKWQGIDSNTYDLGLRTYVTESGVLIGKYPFIYFIDPENTPEGAVPKDGIKDISDPTRPRDDMRMCLASYIKNDQRYMIAAFGAGRYYEIPMANVRPFKPLWDDLTKIPLRQIDGARGDEKTVKTWTPPHEGIGWGYSCHINQRKKIFYSQWGFQGPKHLVDPSDVNSSRGAAVDLNTYKQVDLDSVIPNAKFVQNNPVLKSFALSVSSSKGSYAVGGDPDGNLYNADRDAILPPFQGATVGEGNLTYTMAYEKNSDTIWVSRNTNKIAVIKRKCLTTEPNCTDKDYHFAELPPVKGDTAAMGTVGPISALKDGRVVGLSRSNPTRLRIFSLKDPRDVTKGIDALPLTTIDGDPYMYVDFTGATLYTRESEQTIKISEIAGYAKRSLKDNRPDTVVEANFEWKNLADTPADWKGMKLEAKCYEDSNTKGAYQEIPVVAKAGEKTLLDISSCNNRFVEAIDIKITQITGESLGDIESIKIHVKQ